MLDKKVYASRGAIFEGFFSFFIAKVHNHENSPSAKKAHDERNTIYTSFTKTSEKKKIGRAHV